VPVAAARRGFKMVITVKKLQLRHEQMTNLKLQKLQKGDDYPPAHRLNVNVLLTNITFL